MRDYAQYCPVALASAVIAERWTPLIIRELVIGGRRFNEIDRGLPGISRSLLKQRLDHLERKGVVERVELMHGRGHEYRLTPAGRDLEGVIMAVGEWAVRWMFSEPEPRDVDPVTLTWWMSRRTVAESLPQNRTVVQFDYSGGIRPGCGSCSNGGRHRCAPSRRASTATWWSRPTPVALMRVFSGITSYAQALVNETISVVGPPHLTRALPTWFAWSPFAQPIAGRGRVPAPRINPS